MASLTSGQIAEIRRYIGASTPPTNDDLNIIYARVGSAAAVAQEILQTRYADMVRDPGKWSLEGDYNQDTTKNLDIVAGRLAELDDIVSGVTPGVVTVHSMTREHWSRVPDDATNLDTERFGAE